METLLEGARGGAPEEHPAASAQIREALAHLDAALAAIDRAAQAVAVVPGAGAPFGVLVQGASTLMAAEAMLLRRQLRPVLRGRRTA
jgi:hypothetical protein